MDGHAIHKFHHQIRIAAAGDPTIQKPCNVGMLEAGQNLPLLAKAFAEGRGRQWQVDQLDGYFLLEFTVGSMGEINGAHAATPKQSIQFIGTNPPAGRFGDLARLPFRHQ